jgi:hypothetical protein
MGHGEGLARAGHAEQHLVALIALQAVDQIGDRLRLVAGRLELRMQHERAAMIAGRPLQDGDGGIGKAPGHGLKIGARTGYANRLTGPAL